MMLLALQPVRRKWSNTQKQDNLSKSQKVLDTFRQNRDFNIISHF